MFLLFTKCCYVLELLPRRVQFRASYGQIAGHARRQGNYSPPEPVFAASNSSPVRSDALQCFPFVRWPLSQAILHERQSRWRQDRVQRRTGVLALLIHVPGFLRLLCGTLSAKGEPMLLGAGAS